MLTLTYGTNRSSACSVAYRDGKIEDISTYRYISDDRSFVERATRSLAHLQEMYSDSSYIFRYPALTKGKYQEEKIREICRTPKGTEFKISPFSIVSAIPRFLDRGTLKPQSLSSLEAPFTLYTDASITDNRKPSIGVSLLNKNDQILVLYSSPINNPRNTAHAESMAVRTGVSIVNSVEKNAEVELFCDNERVISSIDGSTHPDLQNTDEIEYLQSVSNIKTNSISGDDNRLADALSKDPRHKEVDKMTYLCPALKNVHISFGY